MNNKLRILTVLLTFNTNAMADVTTWTEVTNTSFSRVYGNFSSIYRVGNLVKMATMVDFYSMQSTQTESYKTIYFRSLQMMYEFDCVRNQNRGLNTFFIESNKGYGKVVYSINNSGMWERNELGSVGEKLWNVACGLSRNY